MHFSDDSRSFGFRASTPIPNPKLKLSQDFDFCVVLCDDDILSTLQKESVRYLGHVLEKAIDVVAFKKGCLSDWSCLLGRSLNVGEGEP